MEQKIRTFTDLTAWRESHRLVLLIYKTTNQFPQKELFSLVDQMRRCGVSVSSNIAEGFSRQGKKEKIQFYYMAKGSLTELQNQLLISRDVGYIDKKTFDELANQTILASKLLMGLIRSVKKF
jgi:four helix bundle protein